MESNDFQKGIDAIRKGERVRVLFDLLMSTLTDKNAPDGEMKKSELFELMKQALKDEHEALIRIMPAVQFDKRGQARPEKRSKKHPPSEGVSVGD